MRTGKFFCHQKILHLETALETGSMDQPVQRHNFPAFFTEINLFLVFLNYYITVSLSCIVF